MTITLQAVNELIAALESAGELSIREQKFLKLAKAFKQLAAENYLLKSAHPQPFGPEMMKALDAYEKQQDEVPETGMLDAFFILRDSIRLETPATDAYLAGIKADGVEEFAAKLRIPGDDQFFDALAKGVALAADDFAKQLREGADK
ncbi:TPA: hypothetical protein MI542_09455 [Klebsiella pneumoniae]|nr:hypothetical protein [Klebsiella pneumoniae]